MPKEHAQVTDAGARRLDGLVPHRGSGGHGPGALPGRHSRGADGLTASGFGPDIVRIDSEVRVRDLDTHEVLAFRVVLPRFSDAGTNRISALAPLGMAVLGRRAGAQIRCQTPGGVRRLRIDRVLL